MVHSYVILFPHSPMFLGYMIPEDAPPVVKIPFCYLITCFYTFILLLNITCAICILFSYGVFAVPFLLHEFRLDSPSYKSIPALRTPENLVLAYRTAQIFLHKTTSPVVLFMRSTQSIVYNMVVFTSHTIFKHGNKVSNISALMLVVWTLMAASYWFLTLIMGGYLHSQGNCILVSWKHNKWPDRNTKKLMDKFRRSCKPFQFSWGTIFIVERLSVLIFVRSLSTGILNSLLAL